MFTRGYPSILSDFMSSDFFLSCQILFYYLFIIYIFLIAYYPIILSQSVSFYSIFLCISLYFFLSGSLFFFLSFFLSFVLSIHLFIIIHPSFYLPSFTLLLADVYIILYAYIYNYIPRGSMVLEYLPTLTPKVI